MRETAGTRTVGGPTTAVAVGVVPPGSVVTPVRERNSTTTLNLEYFRKWHHIFPDSDYATDICETIEHGVNIGFTGPNTKIISKNWPSAIELSGHVDEFVHSNLEKGRIEDPLGPEEQLPPYFRSSPLGAF